MFKFSLKNVFLISFVLSNSLAFAHSSNNSSNTNFPDELPIEYFKTPNDSNKPVKTIDDFLSKLLLYVNVAMAVKEISLAKSLMHIYALVCVFGIDEQKCLKLNEAAWHKELNKLLECVNFGIAKTEVQELLASPNMIDTAITKLKDKINFLEEISDFVNINVLLAEEICKTKDKSHVEFLNQLNSLIIGHFNEIKETSILLEKIKNKDWKDVENFVKQSIKVK